jgi:hypothetical protein
MRRLAVIFSVVGLLLLLLVVELRWRFVQLPLVGFESGLFVASLAFFGGVGASAAATFFAFLQLRRASGCVSSRWLLALGSALLLGFGVLFVV